MTRNGNGKVLINEGWPMTKKGDSVPFFSRADYIDQLHRVIREKRAAVDAAEEMRVLEYDKLKGKRDVLIEEVRNLTDRIEEQQAEARTTNRALDSLRERGVLTSAVLTLLTPIVGLTTRYVSDFIDARVCFYDQDTNALKDYSKVREELLGPLGSVQPLIDFNREKAAEVLFNLAEQGRRLITKHPEIFQDRAMDMRILYELARELTNNSAVSLAAEARLLEMKLSHSELNQPSIDASFTRLAHEDPTLMIGNYGAIKSLKDMTRVVYAEEPPEDAKTSAARFVRAMYQIRCNKRVEDASRSSVITSLTEDPSLITPTLEAALFYTRSKQKERREVAKQLAEIALTAALSRDEDKRFKMYEQVPKINEWRDIFARNEVLRQGLFTLRFDLGFNVGFEQNMGNEAKAQEYEACLARLPQYE